MKEKKESFEITSELNKSIDFFKSLEKTLKEYQESKNNNRNSTFSFLWQQSKGSEEIHNDLKKSINQFKTCVKTLSQKKDTFSTDRLKEIEKIAINISNEASFKILSAVDDPKVGSGLKSKLSQLANKIEFISTENNKPKNS